MKRSIAVVAVLVLVVAALPATATVLAQPPQHANNGGNGGGPAKPSCNPGTAVDNDDLRIWFHGMKGQLQVTKKADDGSVDGKYQYKTASIVEQDADNETIAVLNLKNAQPQSSTCEIENGDTYTNISYTVTGEVVRDDNGGSVGTADVTFVYHFNRTNNSAKFDLLVNDWPWQGDGRLAYDFDVTSGQWDIEQAENGLGFRDPDSGEPEATVMWAPNATATYPDDHEEEAIVDSTTTGDASHVHVDLAFTQASAGYDELDYDPTVAVGPYVKVGPVIVPLPTPPSSVDAVSI